MWDGNLYVYGVASTGHVLSENQCGMETEVQVEETLQLIELSENQCGMETGHSVQDEPHGAR